MNKSIATNTQCLILHGLMITAIIFSAVISCQSSENRDNTNQNAIPSEPQKVIAHKSDSSSGIINSYAIDRIVISYFRIMIDKAPAIKKTITGKELITELSALYASLPVKGDIFKKIAPTSDYYAIEYYAGKDLIVKVNIYNDSVQMQDTSFLAQENEFETRFKISIKKLLRSDAK
jgi:hypothetical protein